MATFASVSLATWVRGAVLLAASLVAYTIAGWLMLHGEERTASYDYIVVGSGAVTLRLEPSTAAAAATLACAAPATSVACNID